MKEIQCTMNNWLKYVFLIEFGAKVEKLNLELLIIHFGDEKLENLIGIQLLIYLILFVNCLEFALIYSETHVFLKILINSMIWTANSFY